MPSNNIACVNSRCICACCVHNITDALTHIKLDGMMLQHSSKNTCLSSTTTAPASNQRCGWKRRHPYGHHRAVGASECTPDDTCSQAAHLLHSSCHLCRDSTVSQCVDANSLQSKISRVIYTHLSHHARRLRCWSVPVYCGSWMGAPTTILTGSLNGNKPTGP